MSELFSLKDRLIFIIVIYVVSLIISLVYLCWRVDFKKTSYIIFISCIIYASLFVFLDIIASFDLFFNNKEQFKILFKYITKIYLIFTIVDKLLGFIIFNILIYYLESGHYSTCQKLLDFFIRKYYAIKKMSKKQIIVILSIVVPIISGLLAILIIYRKHFGLKNPWDYLESLLDCYAIFEIYTCVGFFILQFYFDCRMQRSDKLFKRYYRYSIIKIINKTEDYLNKVKNAYEVLSKVSSTFENNNTNPYYVYLQEQLKKIKEKIDCYELQGNNPCINNIIIDNENSNINIAINNNTTCANESHNLDEINYLKKTSGTIDKKMQLELNNKLDDKGEQIQKKETNKKEKDEDDLPTYIRKYKKSVRRIDKLKLLYKEFRKDLNTSKCNCCKCCKCCCKCCSCGCTILSIALFIVINTDFLIIFVPDYVKNYYSNYLSEDIEFEKGGPIIIGTLVVVLLSVVSSAYTIITIYSTTRKRYITGDFLYDRKINDNLSLIKTVQLICGYSFALLYCNLYYWIKLDKRGALGKPKFKERIKIPDYTIIFDVSIYMIVKIIIIIGTIIISLKFSSVFIFKNFAKNDLSEYDLSRDGCKYDNDNEFHRFLEEKKKINNILSN